jgi:hypothetical protein
MMDEAIIKLNCKYTISKSYLFGYFAFPINIEGLFYIYKTYLYIDGLYLKILKKKKNKTNKQTNKLLYCCVRYVSYYILLLNCYNISESLFLLFLLLLLLKKCERY